MAHGEVTDKNVRLCFEKIKDLIGCLPEEIFESDAELAKKKEMADAALEPLENFLKGVTEVHKGMLPEYGVMEKFTALMVEACDRAPTID